MGMQDLVVIGGGTSGYIVATGALRLGLKVILVEKNLRLGGSALHFGCVPSKTMLHIAQVAHTVHSATQYGLDSYILPIDLNKVNQHINGVIRNLEQQEDQEAHYIFKQLGGQILFGQARFIDPHTIEIDGKRIHAKKFVIATGSSALLPSIKGLDSVGYLTNENLYTQKTLPQRLVILGGKPSAIEFAQAFTRLGSKVSVVVRGDSILPSEDPELVNKLKDLLIHEGIDFYLNTSVNEAYQHNQHKVLECRHESGEQFALYTDEILVALGRRPNVEGLGLENAMINYAADGILVNKKLRTSQKHIYALGDVIRSPYKLTHAAEYQANIVLSNAVFKFPAKTKYQGFPYVIFTSPEYAHVGLSEQQAKNLGYKKAIVTRFEFKDLDSAAIQSSPAGMIKVISNRGRVIGATILGPQASNLIAEWGLAINLGARVADVAATIHAYPTLAQINRRVANKHIARGMFNQSSNWLLGFMQRALAWI